MKKRGESRDATRARIVDATMALHQELGPRATTISAVAERAGVQRLTVYRHFADETALFQACTSRWLELNPPPERTAWGGVSDPAERCRLALMHFYAYYRRTERMWAAAHRDEAEVPALQAPMQAFRDYLAAVRDQLIGSPGAPLPWERSRAVATLSHALKFETWRSLSAEGLDDAGIVALVLDWLSGLARLSR